MLANTAPPLNANRLTARTSLGHHRKYGGKYGVSPRVSRVGLISSGTRMSGCLGARVLEPWKSES